MLNTLPPETASLRMADGVRLDADIYRPAGEGPWPVLLLRQAYGRKVAATVTYAHPAWYAAQGYVVVVQDVRGRGSSEGTFATLEHDARDGAETIAWCASLPGTTGAVGMYGFSLQGMNQLLAAALAGPELKALAPAMIGWDIHGDMVTEGGVPQLAPAIAWAAQLGADSARHQNDAAAYEDLRRAAMSLPLGDRVTARPDVLSRWQHYHHYFRWLDAEPGDDLLRNIAPAHHLEALSARQLPMLFVGGWYDFTLPGTLEGWAAMHAVQPDRTRLVVGPWAHLPWAPVIGGRDFGDAAISNIDALQVAWFDHWLKGKPLQGEPIALFDLGLSAWQSRSALSAETRRWHLGGNGLAAVDAAAGTLSAEIAAPGREVIVHDPWRPAPSCGGRFSAPPGPIDRREVEQRADILTFTSAPLDQPLAIAGWLVAELYASADTPSFDLHCTVSRLAADGRVEPIAEGARRIMPGSSSSPVAIDLRAACITLAPGERLRLSVAGACYPAFAVNPGDGDRNAPQMAARPITIAIDHGPSTPSALVLNHVR